MEQHFLRPKLKVLVPSSRSWFLRYFYYTISPSELTHTHTLAYSLDKGTFAILSLAFSLTPSLNA